MRHRKCLPESAKTSHLPGKVKLGLVYPKFVNQLSRYSRSEVNVLALVMSKLSKVWKLILPRHECWSAPPSSHTKLSGKRPVSQTKTSCWRN